MHAFVFALPLGLFGNGVAAVAAGSRSEYSRPSTRAELEVVQACSIRINPVPG
jgi:hypothetical protein